MTTKNNWIQYIITISCFLTILTPYALAQNSSEKNDSQKESLEQCKKIVSSLQRLACFDRVAGTPSMPQQSESASQAPISAHSEMMQLVMLNEKNRPPEHVGFVLSESTEHDGGTQVMITAPALNAPESKVYLSISCIFNISRLQLISEMPVNQNIVKIRLFMDDRPITEQTTWQVLQTGEVVDAGRGLPGIDLIRRLATPGQRLRIESDYSYFDGLLFETFSLPELIQRERIACHW